jgi:branched-chain amino acid transport system permease protein
MLSALLLLPCFTQGLLLSLMSQIAIWAVLTLSYNVLLGQLGLLSFGHAVYSGLSGLVVMHALNALYAVNLGSLTPYLMALLPALGGLAGVGFSLVLGSLNSQKTGTAFSMISLGICELVFASALMLPGFFGGESGVSTLIPSSGLTSRLNGIDFTTPVQLYYLLTVWAGLSLATLFFLTQTPLGILANALRDNPLRLEMIGHNPQRLRLIMLLISGFFAGVAGGMAALYFEIVTAEAVSAKRSGEILLATVMGGTRSFLGPVWGAMIFVFCSSVLSLLSKAWQLYLGLLFIVIIMCSPDGVTGVFQLIKLNALRHLSACKTSGRSYIVTLTMYVFSWIAVVLLVFFWIEMSYYRAFDVNNGAAMTFFTYVIDTENVITWLVSGVILLSALIIALLTASILKRGQSVPLQIPAV